MMKRVLFVFSLLLTISISESFSQMIIPKFHAPQKIEALSSEAEEGMLLPFNEGKSFYFERTYASGSGTNTVIKRQDIWFSAIDKKGRWDKPYRLFKADYLKGENFIIGTNDSGSRIYLFQTIYNEDETDSSWSDTSRLVYMDQVGKDKWADPIEIKIPGLVFNERYFHFHMNTKENILLISMSPSEKVLSEDLYVSLKNESGEWGNIIHLGPVVNSSRFEVSPYLGNDEKTLYFSSNGHRGYGSADIFMSRRLDDSWQKWSKPLNIGEPINSDAFDAYFIVANNKEVFFASSRGDDHINIYKTEATGEVVFANADSIGGQFFFRGLPRENVVLRIEDENGNFIDEIVTDVYGRFRYVKLENEDSYLIKLAAEDNTDFVGSKVYFIDESGQKTKRYILTEDGFFINEKDITDKKHIKGVFSYQTLPADNIGLVILDENGFPLDTVYLDENGKFSFSVLKYDETYSIVPLDLEDSDWSNIEAYLLDENGKKIKKLEFRGNGFIYEGRKEQIPVDRQEVVGVDKKDVKGAELEVEAWKGMAYDSKTLYFNFNEKMIDASQESKLSVLISILQYDKELKIKLTGHTDNKGSETVNNEFGMQRAQFVKKLIVSKGISPKRVLLESKGESEPISPNSTEEGQAKNRRVEIEIL